MNKEVDINALNYESYVIDYLDGKLDAVETACFIAFLENNPKIKDEVADLGNIKLGDDYTVFDGKSMLKKKPIISVGSINEDNYEEFFIAHFEGDLNEYEESTLAIFITKNSDLNEEFKLYGSLKIEASDVLFKDKKLLKHRLVIGVNWYSSVAAAFLLFAASWFFLNKADMRNRGELANLSKIKLRNTAMVIAPNEAITIETKRRQVEAIAQFDDVEKLNKNELFVSRDAIIVSPINTKVIDVQLVDSYIYSRIISQPKYNENTGTELFKSELAIVTPASNKRKGLIARVLNNQLSKITAGIKPQRKDRKKSAEPTYVKVIDGGLLVFNTITGSETSTVKTYNSEGNITGYQIEGREVMFNGNFGDKYSSK